MWQLTSLPLLLCNKISWLEQNTTIKHIVLTIIRTQNKLSSITSLYGAKRVIWSTLPWYTIVTYLIAWINRLLIFTLPKGRSRVFAVAWLYSLKDDYTFSFAILTIKLHHPYKKIATFEQHLCTIPHNHYYICCFLYVCTFVIIRIHHVLFFRFCNVSTFS